MQTLPAHPNLDQLRHQARELLRAAKAGDPDAVRRIEAFSDRLTLAAAQLALAREYGFASWPKLKDEVDARTLELAEKVDEFCEASVSGRMSRAALLLAETPAIADYNIATAVILGDADRVRAELQRDPTLATRPRPAHGVDGAARRVRLALAPARARPRRRPARRRPVATRRRSRPGGANPCASRLVAAPLRHRGVQQRP